MRIILVSAIMLGMLSACSSDSKSVLKSPCAGAKGSPCGDKYRVNEWWLEEKDLA